LNLALKHNFYLYFFQEIQSRVLQGRAHISMWPCTNFPLCYILQDFLTLPKVTPLHVNFPGMCSV
jgi:hypothetical protein